MVGPDLPVSTKHCALGTAPSSLPPSKPFFHPPAACSSGKAQIPSPVGRVGGRELPAGSCSPCSPQTLGWWEHRRALAHPRGSTWGMQGLQHSEMLPGRENTVLPQQRET